MAEKLSLSRLELLLKQLPNNLPIGSASAYPFANFSLPEHEEGPGAALSNVIKNVFGWCTENKEHPQLIVARRKNVEMVCHALNAQLHHSNTEICKLVPILAEKLITFAEDTFTYHNIKVCIIQFELLLQIICPITQHQ